jgi:hypothetical protein
MPRSLLQTWYPVVPSAEAPRCLFEQIAHYLRYYVLKGMAKQHQARSNMLRGGCLVSPLRKEWVAITAIRKRVGQAGPIFSMMGHRLFYSTRSEIDPQFLGVSCLVCAVALLVGQLLYKAVLSGATNRVHD